MRREQVGSTMDEVVELALAGAPEGTAVVAEVQTAGRGRSGRSWQAAPGSAILLSILLRPRPPVQRFGTLPLLFGVAVAEAIERIGELRPRLKWPNDVWLDGRKVAGVLLTSRTAGAVGFAVVGVGLNVTATVDELPAGATSLAVETGRPLDRDGLLDLLLDRLDAAYRSWDAADGRPSLAAWRERAALTGECVTVEIAGRCTAGIFRDIDDDGALLLGQQDGTIQRIVAGDLMRGPREATTPRGSDGRPSSRPESAEC
jgi:BirA family biotin operon repressor/biotin-[acetyl-CoA-carboxylase] ligase